MAQAAQSLRPSLPDDIDPVMLNLACSTGERFHQRRAQVIRETIFEVVLTLNTVLAGAALHTHDPADYAVALKR